MTYEDFAEVLEDLSALVYAERQRRSISLRQVGRECGVSFATVTRLENGYDILLSNAATLFRWLNKSRSLAAA